MNWTLVVCCSVAVVAAFLVHGSAAQTRAGLNQSCSNTSQCAISTPNSNCSAGRCVCASGYQPLNNTICTLKLNETCNNTRICNQTGAYCSGGKCTCTSNYVFSSSGLQCLKVAEALYQPCTEPKQCRNLENAMCSNSVCLCMSGYVQISSNKCQWGSPCSGYCSNNYQCIGGHCTCPSPNVELNNYCRRVVYKLGSSCNANSDACYETNKGFSNVECKKNICSCIKGTPNKDKTACNGATSSVLASTGLLLLAFIMSRKLM